MRRGRICDPDLVKVRGQSPQKMCKQVVCDHFATKQETSTPKCTYLESLARGHFLHEDPLKTNVIASG